MPIPDLPVELWLEILTYLPRTYLSRMIGVNRILFELALDEKYAEVRFISDDKPMLLVFKQLKHGNIARRVRHLLIRPAFLPGIDEIEEPNHVKENFFRMKTFFKPPRQSMLPRPIILDSSSAILDSATSAVAGCPNLREVTIVIYDHVITPLFRTFLHALWRSVGGGLRILTVHTTMIKLPVLLDSVAKNSEFLGNLEEIDISIVISRFPLTDSERDHSANVLLDFTTTFKGTLTSLSLSSAISYDHTPLFKKLGRIPKLLKFELWLPISASTLSSQTSLCDFLQENSGTLESLTIKPRPRYESFFQVDDQFRKWVLSDFANIELPHVKTLDLGFRDRWTYHERNSPRFLPALATTTPNLSTLILTNTTLNYKDVVHVLDVVSKNLDTLHLNIYHLSPQLLDLFASKMPRLTRLDAIYQGLTHQDPDAPSKDLDVIASLYAQLPISWPISFYHSMESRRYPRWSLQYLRLCTKHNCGEGHPETVVMKYIADTVSQDVQIDKEYRCLC